MKILQLSTDDSAGGAARAAYRIHCAQIRSGLDSRMLVLHRDSDDGRVIQARPGYLPFRLLQWVQSFRQERARRHWSTGNPVFHSFGHAGAGQVKRINSSDAEILNLHWISGLLSIADIGRLKKPVVWTLHDMWPFCGGEHYAPDDAGARFRFGYLAGNRPGGELGPDLNRRAWEKKRRAWARQRFTLVSPSHWLAECARQSVLFRESQVVVIPNPLDTQRIWRPINRDAVRTVLGLPHDRKLILFGAAGGTVDPRKGADLLRESVSRVVASMPGEIELLIYGQGAEEGGVSWSCPVHWMGPVHDDRLLAQACSAADVMVVPSRQDNLPNTAIEAQACGTPVAAFAVGGLPDIVDHRRTGWLARPFDPRDLADGIEWILQDGNRRRDLSVSARNRAVERFAETVVSRAYERLYEQVLATGRN